MTMNAVFIVIISATLESFFSRLLLPLLLGNTIVKNQFVLYRFFYWLNVFIIAFWRDMDPHLTRVIKWNFYYVLFICICFCSDKEREKRKTIYNVVDFYWHLISSIRKFFSCFLQFHILCSSDYYFIVVCEEERRFLPLWRMNYHDKLLLPQHSPSIPQYFFFLNSCLQQFLAKT